MICIDDLVLIVTMNPTDALELIRARRSLRRYRPRPVPREWVMQILEGACWAPSAHNRQPWRFVILDDAALKEELAVSMGIHLRRDLSADKVPPAIIDKDVSRSYDRINSAPLIIVVCMTLADMDVYSDDRRNRHEQTMAVQSAAMAGQNMMLMASSLGLGACWMCAPLFCPDLVRQVLDLPEGWIAQGMVTIGFPAQTREKTRQALETRMLWR